MPRSIRPSPAKPAGNKRKIRTNSPTSIKSNAICYTPCKKASKEEGIQIVLAQCICARTQVRNTGEAQPQTGKSEQAGTNLAFQCACKEFDSSCTKSHVSAKQRKATETLHSQKKQQGQTLVMRSTRLQMIQRNRASSSNVSRSSPTAILT